MTSTREFVRSVYNYDPITGELSLKFNSKKLRAGHIFNKINNTGYIWTTVPGMGLNAKQLAHRIIFIYMLGYAPKLIDHINRNRADNRWINLRAVSHTENGRNRIPRKDSLTGIDGIQWLPSRQRWQVVVCGKYGGVFKDLEAAKQRVFELRNILGGFL